VGVTVDDLDAVADFFVDIGFERESRWEVEDETVDRIIGLDGVRAEVMMLRAPDGSGKLELSKYHAPTDTKGPESSPPNQLGFRHISIEVGDLNAILGRLRDRGLDTVGEVIEYGGTYRLCYFRGPEGLIVELAERVGST
jgi:catechol 2,3-dioxygenase-like lactoylglutathione lyase family enzyme